MLNIILGILMVSMVSASGFMIMGQMSLTAAIADQRENSRRLDVAADAVAAKLGAPTDAGRSTLYALAPKSGSTGFAYPQLPDVVAGVHATVGGVPFRYCPYAPDSGPLVVRQQYVVQGPVAPAALAAFQPAGILVSSGIRGTTPPECDAVRIVDGRLVVDGGLARMISGVKGVSDAQLTDGGSFEMWVSPGASGNGIDAGHPASLSQAMGIWKGKLPKSMVIHLPPASVFSDDDGALSAAFSMPSRPAGTVRSSKLSIVADGVGGAIISANASFDPQGSLALVGVNMPQTVIRLASHNAASIQSGRVAGVDVAAGSSVAFNGGVSVQGGGVVLNGDATVIGDLEIVGSSSTDLIQVPAGGRLVLADAAVVLRGGETKSGIALGGDLTGRGSILGGGTGVQEVVRLVDGGRMALNGAIGGVVGTYSVLGDGVPASLSGSLAVGPGRSGCWAGDVFAFSTPASSGTVVPAQVAPPLAGEDGKVDAAATAQFIANSDARSRATALLAVNRSSWSCGS